MNLPSDWSEFGGWRSTPKPDPEPVFEIVFCPINGCGCHYYKPPGCPNHSGQEVARKS